MVPVIDVWTTFSSCITTSDHVEVSTMTTKKPPSLARRSAAWSVHFFTGTGSVAALLSLWFISQKNSIMYFTMAGIAIAIDALDGTFARWAKTKETIPEFDGALLDNLIDYVNYVIAPAFFLLHSDLLSPGGKWACAIAVVMSSSYQFAQDDAKTDDHYFKGFPSYWNIAVFYLYFWQTSNTVNAIIIGTLSVLVFIPIKYIYPTRLQYVSPKKSFRVFILAFTWIWGAASFLMVYPPFRGNLWLVGLSMGYCVFYALVSFYRTWRPINPKS